MNRRELLIEFLFWIGGVLIVLGVVYLLAGCAPHVQVECAAHLDTEACVVGSGPIEAEEWAKAQAVIEAVHRPEDVDMDGAVLDFDGRGDEVFPEAAILYRPEASSTRDEILAEWAHRWGGVYKDTVVDIYTDEGF